MSHLYVPSLLHNFAPISHAQPRTCQLMRLLLSSFYAMTTPLSLSRLTRVVQWSCLMLLIMLLPPDLPLTTLLLV